MTARSGEYQCVNAALPTDKAAQCPVCKAQPGLWQYTHDEHTSQRVVMCNTDYAIGPQVRYDGAGMFGCPLSFPAPLFYQPTVREALRFWNEYAAALVQLREGQA